MRGARPEHPVMNRAHMTKGRPVNPNDETPPGARRPVSHSRAGRWRASPDATTR